MQNKNQLDQNAPPKLLVPCIGIHFYRPAPFPWIYCSKRRPEKKRWQQCPDNQRSRRRRITLHHRQPLILVVRTATPWLARTEAPPVIRKANAFTIAEEAPSTIRKAEAAAIRKAASMPVGEAAPVGQVRPQAAAADCHSVIRTVVHAAYPRIFNAVKGDGVLFVMMAVGGAVAGAGGLMAHGRGEDVALRVDAAGCCERWQG